MKNTSDTFDAQTDKVEKLLLALEDKHARVRQKALNRLNMLDQELLVQALDRILAGDTKHLQRQALEQLEALNTPQALEILLKGLTAADRELQIKVSVSLARIKALEAIPRFIEMLADPNERVRENASLCLAEYSTLAKESLLSALENPNAKIRQGAAGTLGFIGDAEVVSHLIKRLGDPVEDVRDMAAIALAEIGSAARIDLLVALHFADPNVRFGAVKALGFLKDIDDLPELITMLGDVHPEVAAQAVWAVEIQGKKAIPLLMEAVQQQNPKIAGVAEEILQRLSEQEE